MYTKKASRIQHVVLSEQFREFYYNCVVNQRVVFDYVYYTGKTDVELQAILNHVLATNTWSFVKGTNQILYFFLSFCYARRVVLFGSSWFVTFECYIGYKYGVILEGTSNKTGRA